MGGGDPWRSKSATARGSCARLQYSQRTGAARPSQVRPQLPWKPNGTRRGISAVATGPLAMSWRLEDHAVAAVFGRRARPPRSASRRPPAASAERGTNTGSDVTSPPVELVDLALAGHEVEVGDGDLSLMVSAPRGSAAYQPWRCWRVSHALDRRAGTRRRRSSSGSSLIASELLARSKVQRTSRAAALSPARAVGVGEQRGHVVAHDVAVDLVALLPGVQRVEDVAGLGVEPADRRDVGVAAHHAHVAALLRLPGERRPRRSSPAPGCRSAAAPGTARGSR